VPLAEDTAAKSDHREEPLRINLPNGLTLLRIFLVPFLLVVLLTKFEGRETVGLLIFLFATATDFFDGWLARRRGEITTLGTLLDPIADKLLISAAFVSLVELQLAPAWMVVVILGREFAVSGLRSIASAQGLVIAASAWGKAKMFTEILAASLLILAIRHEIFLLPGKAALWLAVAMAIVSGLYYFAMFLRRIVSISGPLVPPQA
jgi:CDP-diacylglycerol---glycerol-3-phosphate 3-phosphatidyltransferase